MLLEWQKTKLNGKMNVFSTYKRQNFFFFKENPLDRLIIHALTWLPMKMFTTAVMEAAVDCWSWAIVGRPQLEILVKKNEKENFQ